MKGRQFVSGGKGIGALNMFCASYWFSLFHLDASHSNQPSCVFSSFLVSFLIFFADVSGAIEVVSFCIYFSCAAYYISNRL